MTPRLMAEVTRTPLLVGGSRSTAPDEPPGWAPWQRSKASASVWRRRSYRDWVTTVDGVELRERRLYLEHAAGLDDDAALTVVEPALLDRGEDGQLIVTLECGLPHGDERRGRRAVLFERFRETAEAADNRGARAFLL